MQANPRTLDALFNSQLRYVVPMFQRLYVWAENPQWATLWEDVAEKAILQLDGVKTNPHYLGALIIEGVRPNSPREVKRFLIIDGQQRLTTLQLMLCAFRDFSRKNEWKSLDKTVTRYLENSDPDVMEDPDEEIFKLWPTTLNRDPFRGILSAGSIEKVSERFPLIKLGKKRKPEPRSNLVEAYFYFSKCIASWISDTSIRSSRKPEDVAFALLQSLQQDFCVVEISLSEGDDSQEIFYSLNSQGRALSQSDLLRSLIFMRAEKEKLNRDEIFNTYWSKFETTFWSTEVKRGGRSYSRLDLSLRFFLMAKTGQMVDARRVNEEYRRWISATPARYPTIKEELADFSRHGDVYQEYETAIPSALPSTDFRRVLLDFDISTATPLILFLKLEAGLDQKQSDDCLYLLESFIVRRTLLGEETKEYNLFFVEVISSLRGLAPQDMLLGLHKKLSSGIGGTRHWPTDAEMIERLNTRPIGTALKAPILRVILERLEIKSRTKKTESLEISSGLQIEHVMPQLWSTHWKLQDQEIPANMAMYPYLSQEEHPDWTQPIRDRNIFVQTLGNLTLLNKYLNPAASNAAFVNKLIEYKNSVLRLNRYFDHQSSWDEAAIQARGKILAQEICKIWSGPETPLPIWPDPVITTQPTV